MTARKYYVITIDVGGTQIKSAAVNNEGRIINETLSIHQSKSSCSKEEIVQNLANIVLKTVQESRNHGKCLGICFAFPGPFDYENGISYISGVGKYEALYGVNMKDEIRQVVETYVSSDFVENFEIFFENDARLFALGWYISNEKSGYKKVMFISLGTGIGSAFIDSGKLITSGENIPPGGYVYNLEFQNKRLEDIFSARSIIFSVRDSGLENVKDVKELSREARNGNLIAKKLFLEYGRRLGTVLKPVLKRFSADALVIGGQIAKSADLFMGELVDALSDDSISVIITEESYVFTFIGAYNFFMRKSLTEGKTI